MNAEDVESISMAEDALGNIDWAQFDTAYGPATQVPDQLRRLAGSDQSAAMEASHELWCGLCHQHVFVSTAALPALPFLLAVLDRAGEQLTVEILDILLGFAVCTDPQGLRNPPAWMDQLRQSLIAEIPRLKRLTAHSSPDIASFANSIFTNLAQQPGATPSPAKYGNPLE